MKLLCIRADATKKIGTGHIMRCIALAQAWKDKGGSAVFISHCQSNHIQQRIYDEGFELVVIENPYPHPNDLETLSGSVLNRFQKYQSPLYPWIVLDGYHFDTTYQKAVRDIGFKLMVIDDYAHLSHYHTDVLLNQNLYAKNLYYPCSSNTIKLLGTKYVLLRQEFLQNESKIFENKKERIKVLVTLGGADLDNITLKVIKGINKITNLKIEVKIIVGTLNKNINNIMIETQKSSSLIKYSILNSVNNMADQIMWANYAVCAAGSTTMELCYLRVPFIVITTVENQKYLGNYLDNCGAAIHLGWHQYTTPKDIYENLIRLIENRSLYASIIYKQKRFVKENGAAQIVEILNGF